MALILNEHCFETRDWRWPGNRRSEWRGLNAIFLRRRRACLKASTTTTQELCHKFPYLTIKKKQQFRTLCTCIFHFCTLVHFPRGGMTCSAVMWTTEAHDGTFFFLLSPNCWYQLNFRILRMHFASMTSNNWEIIEKTPSYIFGWRSRCRRRRLCWAPNHFSGDCISTYSQKRGSLSVGTSQM